MQSERRFHVYQIARSIMIGAREAYAKVIENEGDKVGETGIPIGMDLEKVKVDGTVYTITDRYAVDNDNYNIVVEVRRAEKFD
jgi:hypothetical protein